MEPASSPEIQVTYPKVSSEFYSDGKKVRIFCMIKEVSLNLEKSVALSITDKNLTDF